MAWPSPRSKRLRTLGIAVGFLAASVAGPALVAAPSAAAAAQTGDQTITITDATNDLATHAGIELDGAATAAVSPYVAPDGGAASGLTADGTLKLSLSGDSADHAQVTLGITANGTGTPDVATTTFGQITSASYLVSTTTGSEAVSYQLPTWCDGVVSPDNGEHFLTFVNVPPPVSADWTTVNVLDGTGAAGAGQGLFWPTKTLYSDGTTVAGANKTAVLNAHQNYAWSDIKSAMTTACSGAVSIGPKLNLGSGNGAADVSYADDVKLGVTADGTETVTTWNFEKTGSAAITMTLPTLDPPATSPAAYTGTITNDGPDIPSALVHFAFAQALTAGQHADPTVKAANFTVEYQNGDTWAPVPLADDASDPAHPKVVGAFGPGSGFPVPNGYNATTNFRVTVSPSLHGVPLFVGATLDAVPAATPPAAPLATFFGVINPVSGPANDCPATLGTGATVRLAYGRYLGRCADSGGYALWKGMLDQGAPLTNLSGGFSFSLENMMGSVDHAYLVLLGRHADKEGLTAWAKQLKGGMRIDTLYASLANSREFELYNPFRVDKVNALYHLMFGRDADSAGIDGWSSALENGMTPGQLASILWRSTESLHLQVTGIYLQLLHRSPEAGGLSSWSDVLKFTGSPYYLEARIGGSTEFILQAQAFPPILPQA